MVEPRIRLVVHYERMDAVGIAMPPSQIYDGVELPDRDDGE